MRRALHALVLCLLVAAPALAAGQCTSRTTKGFWGFSCDGYLTPAPGASLAPTKIMGTCNVSKTGLWTCESTVSLAGTILPQDMSGQAHTAADCTGTITYEGTLGGQAAPPLDIRYFVFDGGSSIRGLVTDAGADMLCELHRLSLDTAE